MPASFDGEEEKRRSSMDDVIDLYNSPEAATAAAGAAAAARMPGGAFDVIDLLGDDDDGSEQQQQQRSSTASPRSDRRFKTDRSEESGAPPSAKKRRREEEEATNRSTITIDHGTGQIVAPPPPGPELQVLEIFPDADVAALQTLLAQFQNNVGMVLSYMADKPYKKAEKGPAAAQQPDGTVVHMSGSGSKWKFDFMSTDSFEIPYAYSQEVTDQLLADFSFLSHNGAKNILLKYKYHYAVCHDKILTAVKGTGDEDAQYDRVLEVLDGKARLQQDQIERVRQCCISSCTPTLKHPRKRSYKAVVADEILLEEVRFVKSRLREWMESHRRRRQRAAAQKRAQEQGTALECACCFDSYPIDDMVACRDEGHLFCMDCLKLYTENQVFGQGNLGIDKKTKQPALELLCCHGDGCSSGFHRGCLEKALPPKTLKKYDEVQFQISIERAGLSSNVCSCPKVCKR